MIKIEIAEEKCIGCGLCSDLCSKHFEIRGDKAVVKKIDVEKKEEIEEVAKSCPVEAIRYSRMLG